MRRLFIIAALMILTGCRTVTSPFEHRPTLRVDDPSLPTSEQMSRGRDRLALPDQTSVLPRTYTEFPDPFGR